MIDSTVLKTFLAAGFRKLRQWIGLVDALLPDLAIWVRRLPPTIGVIDVAGLKSPEASWKVPTITFIEVKARFIRNFDTGFEHQDMRLVCGVPGPWRPNVVYQQSPGVVGSLGPEDHHDQHHEKGQRSTGAAEVVSHPRVLHSHHKAKARRPNLCANYKDEMLRTKTVHRRICVREVPFSSSQCMFIKPVILNSLPSD